MTIFTILFTVTYLLTCFMLCRGLKPTMKELTFGAISVAITVVLSFIVIPLPTGAAISIGTSIPLIVLSIVCGYKISILSGMVTGLLCLIIVPIWQPVHWAQFFVEHLVCFSVLGYATVFGKDKRWKLWCGILLALAVQITSHVLAGSLFYGANAWNGFSALYYSILYNMSYAIPEAILTLVLVSVFPIKNLERAIK